PRPAQIRAGAAATGRGPPARVVDAHPGVPGRVRRRRPGPRPGRAGAADRPGAAGLPRTPRPDPAPGTGVPAGPAVPALRPLGGRHALLVGGPARRRPGAAADPAGPAAPPRGRRGTAPDRTRPRRAAAAPARPVRPGGARGAA